MDVVPGTDDWKEGYDEINKTRDYIASRTPKIIVSQTDPGDVPDGTVWISWT